jgi:hypothetical protein
MNNNRNIQYNDDNNENDSNYRRELLLKNNYFNKINSTNYKNRFNSCNFPIINETL